MPATMNEVTKVGKQQVEKPKEAVQIAAIDVPFTWPDGGYCSTQVETRLTPRQAAALKSVLCRLREDGEFCEMAGASDPRGKRVEEQPHAIRFILDRIADAIEADTGRSLVGDFGLSF